MIKKWIGALIGVAGLTTFSAQATDKMYGVVGSGYGDGEYQQIDAGSETLYLAFGHELSPQWYVEAGFKRLFDDENELMALKADGLYLALLGKAGGRHGELFYKLGAMRTDIRGQAMTEACANCQFDDGIVAGMVGLGFDFHVGLNSMIRLEYEYVRGEDEFSANLFNLAFRYNFN